MADDNSHPIVLFDGVCNLCNRSMRHIIRHDPRARFRLASLQSDAGRALQQQYNLDADALDTVVLIDKGRVYTKSDAALRIMRRLTGTSKHWWHARHIPRPIRDAAYAVIARNRYRWFGRRDECMVPRPGDRERFLDAGEPAALERTAR